MDGWMDIWVNAHGDMEAKGCTFIMRIYYLESMKKV